MSKPVSLHTTAGTVFTQTYSTSATTVPNATVTTLANDADGTAIATAVNALTADVLALRKVINAIIDEMQTAGMVD